MAIAGVKSLKNLDFSYNRIEQIEDTFSKEKMKLDKLLLKENNIKELGKNSFRNFKWINQTNLEGNPLTSIQANTFHDTGKYTQLQSTENLSKHRAVFLMKTYKFVVGNRSNNDQICALVFICGNTFCSLSTLDKTK